MTRCTNCISLLLLTICLAVIGMPAQVCAADAYICRQTPLAKFIDGRFNDWSEPHVMLDRTNWRPESSLAPVYGGPLDLSATFRMAWDAHYLYLAIAVLDDAYQPALQGPLDEGDCIMLRLAPAQLPMDDSVTPLELCLALNRYATCTRRDAEGKLLPAMNIKFGAGRTVLPMPSLAIPREEGKVVSHNVTKLWYELAIPWSALPGITPHTGATLGMELQVLDTDGQGLRGRLKWRGMPGSARTQSDLGAVVLGPSFSTDRD